eukprot:1416033-Amphidinium_carterae.1
MATSAGTTSSVLTGAQRTRNLQCSFICRTSCKSAMEFATGSSIALSVPSDLIIPRSIPR